MHYFSRFTPLRRSTPQMDTEKKVYGFWLLRFFSVVLMILASFVSCKKENSGMDTTSLGNDSPSEAVVADRSPLGVSFPIIGSNSRVLWSF